MCRIHAGILVATGLVGGLGATKPVFSQTITDVASVNESSGDPVQSGREFHTESELSEVTDGPLRSSFMHGCHS